ASAGNGSFASGSSENGQTQAQLYNASLEALDSQLMAKEKALEGLEEQVKAKKVEIQHTRETLAVSLEKEARLKTVSDIIAKDDYDKVKNDVMADEDKLKMLSHELEQLDDQKQQTREEMAYLRENFKTTTLND